MQTCQVYGHHDKKASTIINTQNSTNTRKHQDATNIQKKTVLSRTQRVSEHIDSPNA